MSSLKPDRALNRRAALQLMTSAALLAGCSRPEEEIIPYADMPEGLVAGEPVRYATTLPLSGYGRGFLAIAVDGRPIKIEGNPRHPFSLGATDVFAEAEVLSLYDPDRSKTVRHNDRIATWEDFLAAWRTIKPDARIGLVTGRILSPTTLARLDALKRSYSQISWFRYEPVNDDAARAGSRLAFGKLLDRLPRWTEADCILCLGADPLGMGPRLLQTARAFSGRRGERRRQKIFVAEASWSLTGAAADTRMALTPDMISEIGRAVANRFGAALGEPDLSMAARTFAQKVGDALTAAHGRALVLAGDGMAPELHALCHWLNDRLAAPVTYIDTLDSAENDHGASLAALADAVHARRLDALIVMDANPVHDASDSFRIAEAIQSVPFSAHLGLHQDETGSVTQWHLPLSHVLESWGDERAPDGTASLIQPLIRTLYDTRTRDEFLTLIAGEPPQKAHDLVRAQWQPIRSGDFENWWRNVLEQGVVAETATAAVAAPPAKPPTLAKSRPQRELTLLLSPHPSLWDGRFANNAWLQECPAPFTKEVWGNAIQMAVEDANRLGIEDSDAVTLEINGSSLPATISVLAGQSPGVLAGTWGAGRTHAGRIGTGVGVRYIGVGNRPFPQRIENVRVTKSAAVLPLRSTQNHTRLNGRAEDLFPIAKIGGEQPLRPQEAPPSMLANPGRGEYAWAMVVDADACIGCNACVVACQAENNVPVVGPEEISQGRDMHWLRVDSYARPQDGTERRGFQPVPCMHCELAPCEPVCPVEASVHDHQGLNVQVYNRCIGTRFCEANCPYKVRRFNWFAYAGEQAYADEGAALKAQHNPDVSARGRGVMEKCNYCLQRINRARRTAEKEGREVAEGEMVTACQAACPTRAIHFGDLNRTDSEVSRLRRDSRHYTLLAELNTRPRTTYLKRLYAREDDGDER